VTAAASDAARWLDEAAGLFDLALARAAEDPDELNRLVDRATALVEQAGPAIAGVRGVAQERAVRQAAERAKHSQERLAQAIGLEHRRVADELSRLNAGTAATAGYVSRGEAANSTLLDRVG
jgi:predicted ATP-grasp superfamily ATP-dependent carboligase